MKLAIVRDDPPDEYGKVVVMLAWDSPEIARRVIQAQLVSEITVKHDRTFLQKLLRRPAAEETVQADLAAVIDEALLSLLRDTIRL